MNYYIKLSDVTVLDDNLPTELAAIVPAFASTPLADDKCAFEASFCRCQCPAPQLSLKLNYTRTTRVSGMYDGGSIFIFALPGVDGLMLDIGRLSADLCCDLRKIAPDALKLAAASCQYVIGTMDIRWNQTHEGVRPIQQFVADHPYLF